MAYPGTSSTLSVNPNDLIIHRAEFQNYKPSRPRQNGLNDPSVSATAQLQCPPGIKCILAWNPYSLSTSKNFIFSPILNVFLSCTLFSLTLEAVKILFSRFHLYFLFFFLSHFLPFFLPRFLSSDQWALSDIPGGGAYFVKMLMCRVGGSPTATPTGRTHWARESARSWASRGPTCGCSTSLSRSTSFKF